MEFDYNLYGLANIFLFNLDFINLKKYLSFDSNLMELRNITVRDCVFPNEIETNGDRILSYG